MKIINRKASFEYQLLDKIETGISLTGPEVKSIKGKRLIFDDSFVRLKDGEAWLCNAHVAPYSYADNRDYDPRRNRRLLLHRREIMKLEQKIQQKGLTLVPVSCYTEHGKIKLEIALAKGKKGYEKKEALKKKDLERELQSSLRVKV